MPNCDHEEADTRILIHLVDAFEKAAERVLICTVDTSVVGLLIEKFGILYTTHGHFNIIFRVGRNCII